MNVTAAGPYRFEDRSERVTAHSQLLFAADRHGSFRHFVQFGVFIEMCEADVDVNTVNRSLFSKT